LAVKSRAAIFLSDALQEAAPMNAHSYMHSFEGGLQSAAAGIAGALVADRQIRTADSAEAAQIRGLATDIRRARAQDAATVRNLQAENARLQRELASWRDRAILAEARLRRV